MKNRFFHITLFHIVFYVSADSVGKLVKEPATEALYFISSNVLTFQEAISECNTMGGYLAEVNNEEEHNFITVQLTANNYWIGVERTSVPSWQWITSKLPVGTWLPTFPLQAWSSADYTLRYKLNATKYLLDGRRALANFHFICEMDLEYLCPAIINPTQTVEVPELYTLSCDSHVISTAIVSQTCNNDVIHVTQLVETVLTHTVSTTVTHTVYVSPPTPSMIATGSDYTLKEKEFQKIVKELKVEKKKTSNYMRSLISADDSRPSAKAVGWTGLAILLVVSFCVLFIDILRIMQLMDSKYIRGKSDTKL